MSRSTLFLLLGVSAFAILESTIIDTTFSRAVDLDLIVRVVRFVSDHEDCEDCETASRGCEDCEDCEA